MERDVITDVVLSLFKSQGLTHTAVKISPKRRQ